MDDEPELLDLAELAGIIADGDLEELLALLTPAELADFAGSLPPAFTSLLAHDGGLKSERPIPDDPLTQAQEILDTYLARPHLVYLAQQLAQAIADVEAGINRSIIVSMPPRMGKSTLVTLYLVVWLLRKHPEWKCGLMSHESSFATSLGREVRRTIEEQPLGVQIAKDSSAASEWETSEKGGVLARGLGGSFTGRGVNVLIVDDPHKDFVQAHSETSRQSVWDWWLSVAQFRLEPPWLVVVVMTRWHEDDLVGRLLSKDHEGDPDDWEVIVFPALAEEADALGRAPGEPLISPLVPDETPAGALERWGKLKEGVGSYAFNALCQQRPSPSKGAIFDVDWWRYWSSDPSKATPDDKVIYLDLEDLIADQTARWLDSWDCAFKATDHSDYVVGQRWCRLGVDRFLIDQKRDRMTFTKTLAAIKSWRAPHVPEVIVEDKANGPAVIDVLRKQVSGLHPVSPGADSKTARAMSVTPEIEAGQVYLPHPSEAPWVRDLLEELRGFPNTRHDDQVDSLTQALKRLRRFGVITTTGTSAYGTKIV